VLVWIVVLLPLIFSRPPFEDGIIQVNAGSVIYFSGAYTVGIYLGNSLETRLDYLANCRRLLLVGTVITSALITALQLNDINRFGGFSLQESLYYVQKLCIAALILLWLRSRSKNQPIRLTSFADAAFSIYFLHAFFILVLAHILWNFLRDPI
jgi:membrane-bound acyltransferase YfiQ involved in biofilm formation